MATSHGRPKRKESGGRYKAFRKKRLYELGQKMIEVTIGERKVKKICGMGHSSKLRGLKMKEANVFVPADKKFIKSEIVTVKENPANPHFVRRNIITKGAVIETKIGLVRVTNRPGQEGTINAVLLEKKQV